jgi:ribonuclease HII
MMNWELENSLLSENIRENFICGTDEAGRGPLAGDVYAAAVILPHGLEIEGLLDSKILSPKRREILFDIITTVSLDFCIAAATIDEIDNYNILNASLMAMRCAVDNLQIKPDFVLVDGHIIRGFDDVNTCGIVKGDSLSPNIAAASILAKVARDRYMRELAEMYPLYKFENNKGYPTAEHIERLVAFGKSPVHRESFLKKILPEGELAQIEIQI